jgi:hypothetical protein
MYWLEQEDRKRNGTFEKNIDKNQRIFMKNGRIEEMGKEGGHGTKECH